IFRWMLKNSPGAASAAQKLLLFVFVLTTTFVVADLLSRGGASLSRVAADLGRDFRYVEGALLLLMLWLFGRFRILAGRNLFGLILAYSFWVGLNIMNFALLSFRGNELSIWLRQVFPFFYFVTLVIWCVSLWSLQPEPVQPAESLIERDYQVFVAKTR